MKWKTLLVLTALGVTTTPIPAQVPINSYPTLAIGQPPEIPATEIRTLGPNWVEGKELSSPTGVAVDTTLGAIYVADTNNHRVLGWRDAVSFANGAPADIVLGQRDMYSNSANQPGIAVGLRLPIALAVSPQGHLFVADAGNNRIVKYPRPFEQPPGLQIPTQVLGQITKTSSGQALAPNRMDFTSGSTVLPGGLLFDAAGNLWASDPDNHRVLRFSAASIGDAGADGPNAEMVLGQDDFNSKVTLSRNVNNRTNKDNMRFPSGLGMDSAGRLYVCDDLNRVLVYPAQLPPNGIRALAVRIMGITVQGPGEPAPPPVNAESLGVISGNTWLGPQGVFGAGNRVFVLDTGAHRLLRYAPFDEWPAEGPNFFSPPAEAVIGQPSRDQDPQVLQDLVNRGQVTSNVNSFAAPTAGVFANNHTYIADAGNNRVLMFDDLSTGPSESEGEPYVARRVLGQLDFVFNTANLIEGHEFRFSGGDGGDVAIDTSSDPPRMYVADTGNNRILCFEDARKVRAGTNANMVIGQSDLFRSVPNWPGGRTTTLNDTGLFGPIGVAVDAQGNLYVADSGNSRVLRYQKPFETQRDEFGLLHADLVLGQASFTTKTEVATARTMFRPYGVAFSRDGWLLVSDTNLNRVLMFQPPFENGENAVKVFGQDDFDSGGAGAGGTRLNSPRGIALDTDDRLYVADLGNRRVPIFPRVVDPNTPNGAAAILAITSNMNQPRDVAVSPRTGELFLADTNQGGGRISRYPKYDTLIDPTHGAVPDAQFGWGDSISVALDGTDNLYVSDQLSRLNVFFKAMLSMTNAADQQGRLAPGMWTTAKFHPGTFNAPETVGPVPLQFELAGLQMLVNGKPAPIWYVNGAVGGPGQSGQINFVIHNDAAQGNADFLLFRVSTQEIVAAGRALIQRASPSFFTNSGTGVGQIAALNQDNSRNGESAPAKVGEVVQLFGTGTGFLANAPADGQLAPGPPNLVTTPSKPRISVQVDELPPEDIQYSGLAPGLTALWQINIKVPNWAIPGPNLIVIRDYETLPSLAATTIWVTR